MNPKDKTDSISRISRVPADAVNAIDRNLKALRERGAANKAPTKIHAPLNLSSEPRTDIPSELLVTKPWLRWYSQNVPLDIIPNEDTLPDLLEHSVKNYPDNTALLYFGSKMNYKELGAAVRSFAAGLWDQGIRPGDRVALLLPNCPQFVIAYYGALQIGAIVVPCNPTYVERELEHQLKDAGVSVLVTLTAFHVLIDAVREKVQLKTLIVGSIKDYFPPALKVVFTLAKEKKDGHRAEFSGAGVFTWLEFLAAHHNKPTPSQAQVKPDDVALYQYTGGTTGVPKAAMLTHRNLVTNTRQGWAWIGEGEMGHDITLAVIPFFHVYGMTVGMNLMIYSAGSLVMLPRFVPIDVLKAIQRYRPNLFPGVPAMYLKLLDHPNINKYDLSSIEACLSGAAPLPVEVSNRFEKLTGAKLAEGFGMSECSPISHAIPIFGKRKDGSIGLPVPGVNAKIVDVETGEQDLGVGEIGELVVQGPMVMQGYYNRPDETAKTIRNNWLFTGDIGKMDEDGYFYIVDRKKDMILSGGFNVYPRDVEEILYQHPAVKEAVVIGAPTSKGDEIVKAFVVLNDNVKATEQEILAFCRQNLTHYKAPRAVEFRTELPKTIIGKHLRRVLVEEERKKLAGEKPVASEAPPQVTKSQGLHLPKALQPATIAENIHLPSRLRQPFGAMGDDKKSAS